MRWRIVGVTLIQPMSEINRELLFKWGKGCRIDPTYGHVALEFDIGGEISHAEIELPRGMPIPQIISSLLEDGTLHAPWTDGEPPQWIVDGCRAITRPFDSGRIVGKAYDVP